MKTILENYLYLLTEDTKMDSLEKEYKELLIKLKKLGSENEQLTTKYINTPKEKIPKHAKKIMDEYRETIQKHQLLKKYKTEYSKWLRNGKTGPEPVRGRGYTSYGSQAADDIFRARENIRKQAEAIRKAKRFKARLRLNKIKLMKRNKYVIGSLSLIIILTLAAEAYRNSRDKKSGQCDQFVGKEKEKCLILVRINAYKQQILILRGSLSKVKTEKEKLIIQKKIQKIENKIKELQARYKSLK